MLDVIAGAAAKSAATAITSVTLSEYRNRLSRKQFREQLTSAQRKGLTKTSEEVIDDFSYPVIKRFIGYLESTQYQLIIRRIIQSCYSKDHGKLSSEHMFEIEQSIRIEVQTTPEQAAILADIIVEHLTPTIVVHLAESRSGDKLPKEVLASALPAIDQVDDVSGRHVSVLRLLVSLAPVLEFADAVSRQVAAVHSRMPQHGAGMARHKHDFDTLYVAPVVSYDSAAYEPRLDYASRLVILGDPGAGKSTLVTHTALSIARNSVRDQDGTTVFFLTLREIAHDIVEKKKTIVECIESSCASPYNVVAPKGAVDYLLITGRASVVFDGLDELTEISKRQRVVDAVTAFANLYPASPIFATSRAVGYENAPLNAASFRHGRILSFDDDQVFEYANKWFQAESTDTSRIEKLRSTFMTSSGSVRDLRSNPLMLSLICFLYASEGWIPKNRPELYDKCTRLLYDTWDRDRSIEGFQPFGSATKASVGTLARWMLANPSTQNGVPRDRIIEVLADYLHPRVHETREAAEDSASEVVEYWTGRAWILTSVGATNSQELYAFTHRTFLEYFAASNIMSLSRTPYSLLGTLSAYINDGAHEVVCDICLQMARDQEDFVDEFLELLLDHIDEGLLTVGNTLRFVVKCLLHSTPRPNTRRRVVTAMSRAVRTDHGLFRAYSALLCAERDNLPSIAAVIYDPDLSKLGPEDFADVVLRFSTWMIAAESDSFIPDIHGKFWAELAINHRALVARVNAVNLDADPDWIRVSNFLYGDLSASTLVDTLDRPDSLIFF